MLARNEDGLEVTVRMSREVFARLLLYNPGGSRSLTDEGGLDFCRLLLPSHAPTIDSLKPPVSAFNAMSMIVLVCRQSRSVA